MNRNSIYEYSEKRLRDNLARLEQYLIWHKEFANSVPVAVADIIDLNQKIEQHLDSYAWEEGNTNV